MSSPKRHDCGGRSSYSTYVRGCRCDKCIEAGRRYRRDRKAAVQSGQLEVEHGTNKAYHAGCRCGPCRQSHAEYQRNLDNPYSVALSILRERHRDEFDAILTELRSSHEG